MCIRFGVHLAIAAAALGLSLLAAEAALRTLARDRGAEAMLCDRLAEGHKCRAAIASGRPFDTRTRLEVVVDLAREGRRAWPAVKPAGVLAWSWSVRVAGRPVVPLAGLSDALTVYCNESGEWILYRSDEHGFRNPRGLHTRPLSVAIVGDSYAQGYCVGDDEHVAARVRERFPRTLDLGVDGNGPLIALATLRELAAPLAPRRVVWMFHAGSDPGDLDWELRQPLLRAYLDRDHRHGLRGRQAAIDRQLAAHVERERLRTGTRAAPDRGERPGARDEGPSLRGFLLLSETRRRLARLPTALARRARPRDDLGRVRADGAALPALDAGHLREILALARDETRAWGGELVLVYLPAWEELVGAADGDLRARVTSMAAGLGIALVDAHEPLAAHPDPASLFPYRLRGHYTAEGYALVARAVLAELAGSGAARARAAPP